MARSFTLTIDGTVYDGDDLTLDEMIEVQDMCGGTAYSDLNFGDIRVLRSLAYMLRRRDQPEITLEDIGRIKGVALLAGEEEMPPLPPASRDENQNGSETPDNSGARPSPVSIPGLVHSRLAS